MDSYRCKGCGWIYDEAAGEPGSGIAPGTTWDDVPHDFECPDCFAAKTEFEKK